MQNQNVGPQYVNPKTYNDIQWLSVEILVRFIPVWITKS